MMTNAKLAKAASTKTVLFTFTAPLVYGQQIPGMQSASLV